MRAAIQQYLITALLISLSGVIFTAQYALARPGTPINHRAVSINAYSAYFYFTNAATETVGFEWEVTANNNPVPKETLDCTFAKGVLPWVANYGHPACRYAPIYRSSPEYSFQGYGRELVAFSQNLVPNTRYCFRVRARAYDSRNIFGDRDLWWEGTVSEFWTDWYCATTTAPPPPPPAPSKPQLTYFPPAIRAGQALPDQLLVEWDGRLEPPDPNFRIGIMQYDSEGHPRFPDARCEEQRGGVIIWRRKGVRNLYQEILTNVGPPSSKNRLTIRVCNANRFGCSCSPFESVFKDPAAARGPSMAENSKFGAPSIQIVTPISHTKVLDRQLEFLQVQLTFSGSAPTLARYSLDEGLSMISFCPALAGTRIRCWVNAAQLAVVGNVATVSIPYAAIQQVQKQVHLKLSNRLGESVGTIRILPAYAAPSPALAPKIAQPDQKTPTASGKNWDSPRGFSGR